MEKYTFKTAGVYAETEQASDAAERERAQEIVARTAARDEASV